MTSILGLDMSSTAIGWCLYRSGHGLTEAGTEQLLGDIEQRCMQANLHAASLLTSYSIDAVALESPVARFAKAVIPQARVSGAVLCALAITKHVFVEIEPTRAKLALAASGAASKEDMLRAAASYFGAETITIRKRRGKWCAFAGGPAPIYDEDMADALGVALAAISRVQVIP